MTPGEKLQKLLHDHWGKLLIAQALIVFAAGYVVASLRNEGDATDSGTNDAHSAGRRVCADALDVFDASANPSVETRRVSACVG